MAHRLNRSTRILIAEDDEDYILLLREELKGAHFQNVTFLSNGKDVLDYLHQHILELPDLILLDVRMPGMDGTDVLAAIRADHRLSHLAVLLMSGSPVSEERVRDIYGDSPANGFLHKPVSIESLANSLSHTLGECPMAGGERTDIVEEGDRRIKTIWRQVTWFLADPGIRKYWGEDCDLDYTILRTGPESCKVEWDDGVVAYASADRL